MRLTKETAAMHERYGVLRARRDALAVHVGYSDDLTTAQRIAADHPKNEIYDYLMGEFVAVSRALRDSERPEEGIDG
jgi:hypothetical protein